MANLYDLSNIADQARRQNTARELERRKKLRPADVLTRAATAELLRQEVAPDAYEPVVNAIARRYGECQATLAYIERTAVSPANTAVATWAAELVNVAVQDFMASDMARESAFAALAAKALVVAWEPGVGVVKVPSRASPLTPMGSWVGEGNAKPVYAGAFATTSMTPFKLSGISTFTEEMLASTAIEQIVRDALSHDLSLLLDSALLDSAAATATRPAGLFNGATSVTASAVSPPSEAMVADLKGLAAAVSSANPDARVTYVTNPAQAIRINLMAPEYGNVISSGYMAAGSVGAVDAGAIALLVGQPQFAVSRSAALHMDTVPLPLGTTGSPNVVAAPMRSAFQEDFVCLRAVTRASWAKRRAGAAAIATAVTW